MNQPSSQSLNRIILDHDQNVDLIDYQLARDKVRRFIRPPSRVAQTNLISYAFLIGDVIEMNEPINFSQIC